MTTPQKRPRSGIGDVAMRLANYDLVMRENAVLRAEIKNQRAENIRLDNRNRSLREQIARLQK